MASAVVSSADHLGKLLPESSDAPMLQQQKFTAAVDAAAAARARALVGWA
ncbi:hypothetical protein HaLaN_23376, partial [Haematococcus lacustris]